MTTPEQQARDLLDRISIRQAHHKWTNPSAGELVELANLIAERDALKAELAAIKQGAGEPVAWGQLGTLNGKTYLREKWDRRPYPPPPSIIKCLNLVPLYTRPSVPLTDEKVKELILEHFLTGENQFNEVHQDYRFRSRGTATNVWGADLLKFARAIEAHIKGAKG